MGRRSVTFRTSIQIGIEIETFIVDPDFDFDPDSDPGQLVQGPMLFQPKGMANGWGR
jgi:hypothetical protein